MVKCEAHGEDEPAAGEPSQEELAAAAQLEEQEIARILQMKTLELGQSEADLETELRGAPEEMLVEAEFEEDDMEDTVEDTIPATQPDPVTPGKEVGEVEAELLAAAASIRTEEMDSEDVRKKHLSMRAAERQKKEDEKAAKEDAKKSKPAAKPKAKGRPRKADPPEDAVASPALPTRRLKKKTTVEVDEELEEIAKDLQKVDKMKKPAGKKQEKADLKEKKQEKPDKKKKKEEQDKEPKKKAAAKKPKKKEEAKPEKENEAEEEQKTEKKRKEKKPQADDAAAPAKRQRRSSAGGEVDPNFKAEMIGVIKTFQNKEYDRKADSMHHGKYGDDVQVVVYWSRGTVGVKLRLTDGLAQKYYYSIKGGSIALNICLASKICAKLQENGVDWHSGPEALQFDKMLRATAIAAVQSARDVLKLNDGTAAA